jgi:hypothetical protein
MEVPVNFEVLLINNITSEFLGFSFDPETKIFYDRDISIWTDRKTFFPTYLPVINILNAPVGKNLRFECTIKNRNILISASKFSFALDDIFTDYQDSIDFFNSIDQFELSIDGIQNSRKKFLINNIIVNKDLSVDFGLESISDSFERSDFEEKYFSEILDPEELIEKYKTSNDFFTQTISTIGNNPGIVEKVIKYQYQGYDRFDVVNILKIIGILEIETYKVLPPILIPLNYSEPVFALSGGRDYSTIIYFLYEFLTKYKNTCTCYFTKSIKLENLDLPQILIIKPRNVAIFEVYLNSFIKSKSLNYNFLLFSFNPIFSSDKWIGENHSLIEKMVFIDLNDILSEKIFDVNGNYKVLDSKKLSFNTKRIFDDKKVEYGHIGAFYDRKFGFIKSGKFHVYPKIWAFFKFAQESDFPNFILYDCENKILALPYLKGHISLPIEFDRFIFFATGLLPEIKKVKNIFIGNTPTRWIDLSNLLLEEKSISEYVFYKSINKSLADFIVAKLNTEYIKVNNLKNILP